MNAMTSRLIPRCRKPDRTRRGFSLTEILVVVGVIALLVALLLPALSAVTSSGWMTESMARMRQVAHAMSTYASDNDDTILASQFNHQGNGFTGFVRSGEAFAGEWELRGTWADTLWTRLELGLFPEAALHIGNDYHNDSPDKALYELLGDNFENALRSAGPNTRNFPGDPAPDENLATPFGPGAQEVGWPGYFAANNFFNADSASSTFNPAANSSDRMWTMGQIRIPSRSMYLVDSFAGETIEDEDAGEGEAAVDPFNNEPGSATRQVDFRYNDVCIMMYLDGHVDSQSQWVDLDDLEEGRKVRVRELDKR